MKRVVACLALAVAVVGCGSSEPGWQDEYREQTRRDVNDPAMLPPVDLLQICAVFDQDGGRDFVKAEIFAVWAEQDATGREYEGSGRPLAEILADFGLVENAAILDETAEIYVEELERACP